MARWEQCWTPVQFKEALVRRDEQAWATFLQDYGGLIWTIVSTSELETDKQKELFDEIITHFVRRIGQWNPSHPLLWWLYKVTRNRCIDWIRRRSRQPETDSIYQTDDEEDLLIDFPSEDITPEEESLRNEEVRSLTDCMNQLEGELLELLSVSSQSGDTLLNRGEIPAELRQGFENQGISLAVDATVTGGNGEWVITEEGVHTFLLRHEETDINVFYYSYRLPIFLQYWRGCQYDEIAQILGQPKNTVASRIRRGKIALKDCLIQNHPELFGSRDELS